MNKKRIYILLFLILMLTIRIYAQEDPGDPYGGDGPPDPGGTVPIPGIIYFLIALLGIGIKKIRDGYKK